MMVFPRTILGCYCFLCVATLLSCVNLSYKYNGISYETPEEALATQKKEIDSILASVTVSETHIGSTAAVVYPSEAYVRKNLIDIDWWSHEPSIEVKEKMEKYMTAVTLNNFRVTGEGLKKSQLFDSIEIYYSDNPENAEFEDDYVFYYFKKDRKLQWFVKRKRDNPKSFIGVEEITPNLPPSHILKLWLEKIETVSQEG